MSARVCLIGFGEVGQMLAGSLRARAASIAAWDLKFTDAQSQPRRAAAELGVVAGAGPEAAAQADVVISAVTAAQIEVAARAAAPHLLRGAWYFDLNSTSPAAKAAAGGVVAAAGGRYVEAAVMSPIAPRGATSPMLIGGEHARGFQPIAAQLGFTDTRLVPGPLGSASAAKMCRSVIVKGLEALVLESLLAARRHGVEELVLESLSGLRIDDWREGARYMASRALLHGRRRAEEMREVSRIVSEAGLTPRMSAACVDWQEWAGTHSQVDASDLPRLLDELLKDIPRGEAA